MTPSPEILQAVELLLEATFSVPKDGQRESFLFGQPGASMSFRNLGTDIFHTKVGLLKAALHLRKSGPTYLKNLSLDELQRKLTDFLTENYWILAQETWGRTFSESYSLQVSASTKTKLALAIATSEIYSPRSTPTLFPLVSVAVTTDFDSEPFFLIQPESLNSQWLRQALHPRDLLPGRFPPIPNWQGRYETPRSWLGARSPTVSSSRRIRNVVLGAAALLPHPRQRHMFSGREMFGGRATLDTNWSFSFGNAHTPPLMEDIVIGADDHEWLSILAAKLTATEDGSRKQLNALEYYYRAWPLGETDRFPVLFMCLDAVFGDASRATRAVVEALGPLMGSEYGEDRLKHLLGLRAAVIHGGAPDVYDSSKYFTYYERYTEDPIYDLELIAARALQRVVFDGKLVSRPHPHAALLKQEFGVDV